MTNNYPQIPIKDKFLIFLHIQKTGGITIQRVMRRKEGQSLTQRLIRLLRKKKEPSSVIENFQSKTMKDRYLIGHFCYGIDRYLPKPSIYLAFLREPVSRIISLYEYSQSNPSAYYHAHAVNISLEEFALNVPLMELDNGQVRFLAGDQKDYFINRTPIGACDQALLQQAIDNIERDFALVGLTEHFDESLLLMKEMLGWQSCLYLRRNTGKSRKSVVSEELKEKIRAKNYLDVQLYQYAEQRLRMQLEHFNLSNPQILEDFQKRNALFNRLLNKPYSFYDFLKATIKGEIGRPS